MSTAHTPANHANRLIASSPLSLIRRRAYILRAITKVAQRPDHLVDATGVVTEDLAVLLEPAGRHGMVGRGLQMFASMPEVDHLGFG